MTVTSYIENNTQYWQVYLNLRSKINPTIRVQKRIKRIESEAKAKSEEKKLIRDLSDEIGKTERLGATWEEVIDRWRSFHREHSKEYYAKSTLDDYVARLRNYTRPWLKRPACELNRGDGRDILKAIELDGATRSAIRSLKITINVVYKWGIEEKYIPGVFNSPVQGLKVKKDKQSKAPEILTRTQIRDFLAKARHNNHPWYHIWAVALLTGLRTGELIELKWSDMQLNVLGSSSDGPSSAMSQNYGLIRLTRSWIRRERKVGPTKGTYWRTIPISSELSMLLEEIRSKKSLNSEYVLPRFSNWLRGTQAEVLRDFCKRNGIPSVKFHTLRACFATQLLADGVSSAKVMKICGWKDLETMERYIRLAGIDEMGATESLEFLSVPTPLPDLAKLKSAI